MEKLREIYPQRQFVMSRFEEVFDHIEARRDELATLKGEFIDGKYMRVHRTIGSTRMDIKIAHARIENKIVNVLEPLATLASAMSSANSKRETISRCTLSLQQQPMLSWA